VLQVGLRLRQLRRAPARFRPRVDQHFQGVLDLFQRRQPLLVVIFRYYIRVPGS
jgi:hypothetical protein